MTKDGRPSRLNDIRFFFGDRQAYLKGLDDALAYARRIALYLNGEEVSLGSYSALYLCFTPSLPPGVVNVTDEGGDWWQRYTYIGVPEDFPAAPRSSKLAMGGTVAALQKIRPDLSDLIADADQVVRAHRDELRFLIKTREMKKYVIDLSCNISAWPAHSFLFVTLMEKMTGTYLEAPPIQVLWYGEAFSLAGDVRVTGLSAKISPNKSVAAKLASERQGGPLDLSLSEFQALQRKPVFSKRVKMRG